MSEYSSYTPGTPMTLTLCLGEDSILLNEAVLEALGHPRQVQMLINDGQQMLLIQVVIHLLNGLIMKLILIIHLL